MLQHYTPHQFNQLPAAEKYALIEEAGMYLDAYYLSGPHKVALFYLSGLYIEVWLHQAQDKLIKAAALTSYTALDPFLSSINITPLFAVL